MNKLSPIIDITLLTLLLTWSIWSWQMLYGVNSCVIERSVVSQINGEPVTVRVDIIGKGKYEAR